MSRSSAIFFTTLAIVFNILGIYITTSVSMVISIVDVFSGAFGIFELLVGLEPSGNKNNQTNTTILHMGIYGLCVSLLLAILALYFLMIKKDSAAKASLLITSLICFISTIGGGFLIFILYFLPVLMDIKEKTEKNLETTFDGE